MANDRTEILFPVGRMVMGDLYEPNTKDGEGKPLLVKNGPNTGQPRVEYFIGVAIPKGQERGWWETPWGKLIYATGAAAFPQACQSPTFSWKIDDGDSQVPNMKGRKPCDNEGWRGHWVLKFASGYAPKVVSADGSRELVEPGAVKPGYFVQIFGNVVGNGSQQRPGIRLNPNGVALAGYGEEIKTGRDLSAVGFGQGVQLPAGASTVPLAGMTAVPPGPAAPGVPGVPAGFPAGAPAMPMMPGAAPAMPAAPISVQPNPAFLNTGVPGVPAGFPAGAPAMPMMPAAPAAPVAPPPAAPVRQMTALANGASYESFVANGWTDAQMVANGYMLG